MVIDARIVERNGTVTRSTGNNNYASSSTQAHSERRRTVADQRIPVFGRNT